MTIGEKRLPVHAVTTVGPRGLGWHLTVACPQHDATVSSEQCAGCARLRELLPPDEEGRAWIVCEPTKIERRDRRDAAAVRVADVMTRDVYCVRAELTAKAANDLLLREGFLCAPVIDETGAAVGIVNRTDLMRIDNEATQIARLMSPTVTLAESLPLTRAASVMAARHVHTAPVLDAHGKIVGILSALDVLRWLSSLE